LESIKSYIEDNTSETGKAYFYVAADSETA